jgi:hypothetical protein
MKKRNGFLCKSRNLLLTRGRLKSTPSGGSRIMKFILFFLFFCIYSFIFGGCKKSDEYKKTENYVCQNIDTNIKSIYVLFFNYSFNTVIAVDCDEIEKKIPSMEKTEIADEKGIVIGSMIDYQGVLDSTITNIFTLHEIEQELKKLKVASDSLPCCVDARISCLIKYKDGQEDKLCIGGYSVDFIEYNGISQEPPYNKLLYLIKNSIGYYSWMGDRMLEYSSELQDKSFQRDSVKGHSGKYF